MDKQNLLINIWIVNGFILLVLTLIGLGFYIHDAFFKRRSVEFGAVVGEDKSKAIADNKLLQTVDFSRLSKIQNSSYSLLQIQEVDYMIAKNRPSVIPETQQLRRAPGYYRKSFSRNANCINILFYSKDKKESRLLLNEIGFISHIDYPSVAADSLQSFILYEIAFKDSNADGRLNSEDDGRIFISDLTGLQLRQLVPDSLTVYDYQYNPDDGIIYFKTKALKDGIPTEHIDSQLFIYDITSGTLSKVKGLNGMIEKAREILVDAL